MNAEEYHQLLSEIVDIDMTINSIADSRRLLAELNQKEEILIELKESIVKNIRIAESSYLKEKSMIRSKYSMKQKTGITAKIMGSPKNKLIKELKRLESNTKKDIDELIELRLTIEDFLIQFNDIKGPVGRSMRDRFGN